MSYTAALFLIGSVAGYLAFAIGKWRHTCLFWMAENRANVPFGWRKPAVPLGSLIFVAVLSLVFATLWALLIAEHISELLGLFAWGVLLAARWFTSQIAALAAAQKERKQIEIDIATRTAERQRGRIEDIPEYTGPRDPKVEAEIDRLLAEIRGEKKKAFPS